MALDPFVTEEFLNTFAGKLLGEGMSRKVFDLPLMPGHVVKIEEGDHLAFQNVMEWKIWQSVEDEPIAKWFAPCVHISPNGRVLIMKKTTPIGPKLLPKRIPAFFTDLKMANFGLIGGRPVCHDYGVNLIIDYGTTGSLKKADWWGT